MSVELKAIQTGYKSHRNKIKKIGPVQNLNAKPGELVALIGPNGAGKSTLLRSIANIQKLIDGEIFINGKELSTISRKELSTLVSFVSTENVKVSYLTVLEMVALGRFPYTNWIGMLENSDIAAIEKAISLMRLNELKYCAVTEISDGERQRCSIARAIAQNTPIIVLDEPTAFLDLQNKHEIVHLLSDLAHLEGKTVVFSTHDLNIALTEADKIWLLEPDRAKQAAPEDFLLNRDFDKLFGHNLCFDPKSLTVLRKTTLSKYVNLIAENEELNIFTCKGLNRKGFETENNAKTFIRACLKDNRPVWIVEHQNQTTTCYSVYELCNYLETNYKI